MGDEQLKTEHEKNIRAQSGIPTGSAGFQIIFAVSGVGMLGVLVSHLDLFLKVFLSQNTSTPNMPHNENLHKENRRQAESLGHVAVCPT